MIVWSLKLPLPEVVISNPAHGEVFLIQHYVIKFVSDLRQDGGFLWLLQFPPPIKLTSMIQLKFYPIKYL
jgi:hypothetical protein